jgi:penicillin-insensitive murein DD-endopeptidase
MFWRLGIPVVAIAMHAAAQSPSRAIGAPNSGRLENAIAIEETPRLMLQPSREQRFYATAELITLLHHASGRVGDGPRLMIGTLSERGGGRIAPHSSHQNGRDADVGFFMLDAQGHPVEAPRFIVLDSSGCGVEQGQRYCLDSRRTFQLIAALADDPAARVQMILIASDLRALLLEAGRNDPALARVAELTAPHDASEAHRNHLHVRIFCPTDDVPACIDDGWVARPRAQHRPRRHRARRRSRRRRARRG